MRCQINRSGFVDPGVDHTQAQRPDRVHSVIEVGGGIRLYLPQDRPVGEGKTLVEKHRPKED